MKAIFVISINTFREIIRDRILYGLLIFALFLIGISMILGQLSFAEQVRISMNFGLTAIHLGAVILSIFVGSTLVNKEIDKKTIMTILVRPISRVQFILGKAIGLSLLNMVMVITLSAVLALILVGFGAHLRQAFFISLFGILLEGLVLLGITLFFSSFTSPMLVVSFSIGVFLIGHWQESLKFFAEKSQSSAFLIFQNTLKYCLPNLENLNWRTQAVYGDWVPGVNITYASIYALGWFFLMVTLTTLIMRKKDFA